MVISDALMKRTVGFWVPEGLETDRNIWMLTFECAGVVRISGLGEVVPNLAKSLAKDLNVR